METIKTLMFSVMVFVGIYLAIFLSYILIPASVFLFVFFVLSQIRRLEKEDDIPLA